MPDPLATATELANQLLLQRQLLQTPSQSTLAPVDPAEQDRIANAAQARKGVLWHAANALINGGTQAVLGAIGLGDSSDKANEAGQMLSAIVPLASPIRDPIWRAMVHDRLIGGAGRMSETAAEAIGDLVDRYPRIMAHVTSVGAVPDALADQGITGLMIPHKTSKEARAAIQIDPILHLEPGSEDEVRRTAVHEAQHVADLITDTDRARRQGLTGPASAAARQAYPKYSYERNPYEIAARVAEEAQNIPQGTPNRLALARQRAASKLGFPGPGPLMLPDGAEWVTDPNTGARRLSEPARKQLTSREARTLQQIEQALIDRTRLQP